MFKKLYQCIRNRDLSGFKLLVSDSDVLNSFEAMTESEPVSYRSFQVNLVEKQGFRSNSISTTKYNLATFFPKFFYEQFRKLPNLFFLILSIFQLIPGLSPIGSYTTIVPLTVIISVSCIKELVEDIKRRKSNNITNNSKVNVLKWVWEKTCWKDIRVGDLVQVRDGEIIPVDMLLISTSEEMFNCYIETSNLDGETNYKIKQSLVETSKYNTFDKLRSLKATVECEQPNNNIYSFSGNIALHRTSTFAGTNKLSLNESNIVLRGSKLKNTDWIIGIAVYTGHDTKIMMNSTSAPIKYSSMEKITNMLVLSLIILLILLTTVSSIIYDVYAHTELRKFWFLNLSTKKGITFHLTFLTFFILYHNIIPISLIVTLEFIKFVYSFLMNYDKRMYDEARDTYATVNTSAIIEELGQINYIFTDKTGTLTQNIMVLQKLSIDGIIYGQTNKYYTDVKNRITDEKVRLFLTHLTLCNSVLPEFHKETTEINQSKLSSSIFNNDTSVKPISSFENNSNYDDINKHGIVAYQSSSPDEIALVNGLTCCDVIFLSRDSQNITFSIDDITHKWEILNIFEFSSDRKKMSVIVRSPEGQIYLFCKGADTAIYDILATNSASSSSNLDCRQQTHSHMEEFAKDGLRTLCIAYKLISRQEYDIWNRSFYEASVSIDNRSEKLEKVISMMEKDLYLLGATGIVDKLQDDVKNTISLLSEANIKFWMLTGDRLETAINIGYSTALLDESVNLLTLDAENLESCKDQLVEFIDKYRIKVPRTRSNKRKNKDNYSPFTRPIINDGYTMNFQPDNFTNVYLDEQVENGVFNTSTLANVNLDNNEFHAPDITNNNNLNTIDELDNDNFQNEHFVNINDAKLVLSRGPDQNSNPESINYKNDCIFDSNKHDIDDLQFSTNTDLFNNKLTNNQIINDDNSSAVQRNIDKDTINLDKNILHKRNKSAISNIFFANSSKKEVFSSNDNQNNRAENLALIITGRALTFSLDPLCFDNFLDLAISCKTVICCRVSPLQKKLVVSAVKNNVHGAITLAIGDGGNDCSMIQTAHVGVGISGREGMQAANCSDFSISQFKFLRPLLLYHGASCYRRLCNTIYFCFYKNVIFSMFGFVYFFYNSFSGTSPFPSSMIALLNLFFTSLPPFAFGLFDQACSYQAFVNIPYLYESSQKGTIFNYRRFIMWMLNGISHCLLLFFILYESFENGILNENGDVIDMTLFSGIIYTYFIILVSFKAALELTSWTWITHLCVWTGPIVWFVYLTIYCRPFLSSRFEPNMINLDVRLYGTPIFWFGLGIPFVVLLLDFIYLVIRNTIYKPSHLAVLELERSRKIDWNDMQNIFSARHEVSNLKNKKFLFMKKYLGFAFSIQENLSIKPKLSKRF